MAGVNVKMGVTGVAQFKQNINQARNSLKTLDAQLALNEKQFKSTGDSETYMKQKSELLQKQMEEQKSVIENAERALKQMTDNGVSKASKAYQDMQRQLAQAKGDLLDSEGALNRIGEAGEDAGSGVDAMNTQLKRIGDGVNYQNVISGLDSITKGMQTVVKKAWQMGEAIVRGTLGAGSWADELMTTAAQYEISPEQLQRMRKTANLIDTDADTIISAQQKMRQGIGKRDKEAMGAFAALLGDYDPTIKDAEDAFWDVGKALMNLDNEYDKQVYAQKLFGKSWRELIPLFSTGREEYDRTMASWNVLEQDQLDDLGKMDDQYQKMTSEFETFKMEMLTAFSGPMTEGMETITGLFRELNAYLDTPEGQAMLKQMGETISSLIKDLTEIDPQTVVGGLQTVINGITDALKWIADHSGEVVTALDGMLSGWAALKVKGGVLKVLEVVNGLKWLKSNPNVKLPSDIGTNGGGSGGTNGGAWKTVGNVLTSTAAKVIGGAAAFGATLFENVIKHQGNDDVYQDANGEYRRVDTNELAEEGHDTAGFVIAEIDDESVKKIAEQTAAQNAEEETVLDDEPLLDMNQRQIEAAQEYWDSRRLGMGPEEVGESMRWLAETMQDEPAMLDKLMSLIEDFEKGPMWQSEDLPDWWFPELQNGLDDAFDSMESAVDDLVGDSGNRKQATSDLNSATASLSGLPGVIQAAIQTGMSGIRVYIDGQAAGGILTPYVGAQMAGMIQTVSG